MTGVPIVNTAVNLDFGGSYQRRGTILSALQNIAAISGAEFYEEDGRVFIVPNKAITQEGVIVSDSEIFDFVSYSTGVYNKGVGFVIVQNGGTPLGDVIAPNKIYAEVNECNADILVFCSPKGDLEHSKGISTLTDVLVDRREERSMLDDDMFMLDASISSIVKITLNGIEITDYNFKVEYNTVYFNETKRGTLEVVYVAYGQKGVLNVSNTPMGRFASFDLYYLDQIAQFQGFFSPNCTNTVNDGDMTIVTEKDLFYNKGFNVWTIGGEPSFFFYNRNILLGSLGVTSTSSDYISVEKANLDVDNTYTTRYVVKAVLGVRSKNVDIPYTFANGKITLTRYYPDVEVSYTTASKKHFVKFSEIPNSEIIMSIKNENTGIRKDFPLSLGENCKLPQLYTIDIGEELGLEPTTIHGVSLAVHVEEILYEYVVIDNFGKVKINVTANGKYVIDTTVLKDSPKIILTVDTNKGS